MLKVLNVLFDDRYGGPQKRVIDVGSQLSKKDICTIMVIPKGNGNSEKIAKLQNLKVVKAKFTKTPSPKKIIMILKWLYSLPVDVISFIKIIKNEQCDIVHVNGAFFLAPAIAAKICRKPLVWHLNDTIVPLKMAKFFGFIVRLLATKIVVAAHAVANHYQILSNYTVIYAPVNTNSITPRRRPRRGEIKNIGMIGNWNPLKGIGVFIESASILNSKMQGRVKFLIAGSRLDTQRQYAESIDALISEKKLGNLIDEQGFVSDINNFLHDLDVLVLSSISEASPMAILEAMSAGVPIVATNVGGVSEMINGKDSCTSGLVVDSGDSKKMAECIQTILEDELLSLELGKCGRELAILKFSLIKCSESHKLLYSSLIK